MQLPASGPKPNASADVRERTHACERFRELFSKKLYQTREWDEILLVDVLLRLQPANQNLDALLLRVNCRSRLRRFCFGQRTIEIACR